MNKSVFLIISILFIGCNKNIEPIVENPGWDWVRQIDGNNIVYSENIYVDGSGNIFVIGEFLNIINVDGRTLSSYGDLDIYIAKFDALRKLEWIKQAGGESCDRGFSISVDNDGNCYVTGCFKGDVRFGDIQLTSQGDFDIFIAKYNSSGKEVWVKQAGGTGYDNGHKVSISISGYCYVTGVFTNNATFSGVQLMGLGSTDIFIAKYSPSGDLQWVKQAGGIDDDIANAIAVDIYDNCYITGCFKGLTYFGTYQILPNYATSRWSMYVSKISSDGYFQWVRESASSGGYIQGWDIALDGSSNCYVSGCFSYKPNFEKDTLKSMGKTDIFIAKYNTSGNLIWIKAAGGTEEELGYSISSDLSGNCFVAGVFQDTASFGQNKIISSGNYDIFITKLNTSGEFVWTRQAGGAGNDYCYSIFVSKSGDCYVCGFFSGSASFGNYKLISSGQLSVFFGKVTP